MTNDVRMALMKLTLECVAAGNEDLPVLRCMEMVGDSFPRVPCLKEAQVYSYLPGLGHVVLCSSHAHRYSSELLHEIDAEKLSSGDLAVIIGNLRDQAREVLSATA